MISIHDPGQTLSAGQVATLTAKAAAYPFDLHVEIQTQYPISRAAFEHQVAGFVTPGSRLVSIGVDPLQHFTFVRSSSSLGVPPGPQVAQAGNAFFKAGNLVDGIDAIAAKANELKVEPRLITATGPAGGDVRVVQSQTGVPIIIHEHHTAAGVWYALGAFVAFAAVVVWWFSARARRRELAAAEAQRELDVEASELRSRNIEEAGWHDSMAGRLKSSPPAPAAARYPSTVPNPPLSFETPSRIPYSSAPVPQPIIVNQQGGGLSGVDLLLGYELGRDSSRPAPIVEPVIVERDSTSSSFWSSTPDPSPSPDTSSSSSWDSSDDSSSSSGFDSGSSDSGSSGGDSGGGSDW